jgi:polygalacturonase
VVALLAITRSPHAAAAEPKVFNVRQYGARGDGRTPDTAAIHRAVEACAAAGGGRVLLPPGRYLSGTVQLPGNLELHLEAGATLLGSPTLADYRSKQSPWHRALLLAHGVKNLRISGPGTIDGNRVFDPQGEEHMRGPHTILFDHCQDVAIRELAIRDSGNYAIFFESSDRVEVRNVRITGGWDGVHFRGRPEQPCHDVTIAGCRFATGDDSVAGRYWERVRVSHCELNSSCNCVRLIGPATHLTIENCRLSGPGEYPHRTSNRHNALAGLNFQPGAWDGSQGRLDDVDAHDLTMQNVATPFHFVLKPGNTAGRVTVSRVKATGVYFAAASVESWAEKPWEDVTFRDVQIEFSGGGKREEARQPVAAPGNDCRPLPAWGFYLRNVRLLTLDRVRLSCRKDDLRPALVADGVERLMLRDVPLPQATGAEPPLVLKDVKRLDRDDAPRKPRSGDSQKPGV